MKKVFIIIFILIISFSVFSQDEDITTDVVFIKGHKFVLIETEDRVAEIKVFSEDGIELPISGVIKMPPPVYFLRKNNDNNILQNKFITNNEYGDTATAFFIVGNRAPLTDRKLKGIKSREKFCGINIQAIVMYNGNVDLTEFVSRGFACIDKHSLGIKDLRMFVDNHFKIKKKKAEEEKRKKKVKK